MPASPQESQARRYRIEKYLTEGGMGAIYIGKKLGPSGFAKEVVLKQLLPEYTSRPEFRDLFFREAKISATLDHANIVHTFDLVESDQSLFIVMEYVRGADLRTIIRRARQRKRELSSAAAIYIALEILAGLGYAHARRDATGKSLDIIHRDVSPSNIICSAQGAAKLSDFGIAKASTYSSVFYRVRGKVGYMSPEQARSQTIDHRCDLFSLAVCLYESLSGERLFVGDLNTPADEIYGVPILPVSQKRAGLPRTLDDVMARALAPDVGARYQSAAELGEALRTVAHRNGMAFSSPELAAHLRDILGDDPERWLRDEPTVAVTDPQPASAPSSDLVGTEAASIGIVSDMPEDELGRAVLSPSAVSGSKDFDLDSMLNDEATRPGGEPPSSAKESADAAEYGRVRSGTPPPVWTRNSSPFPLATPSPVRVAPPPAASLPSPSPPRHMSAVPGLPGVPAAPSTAPSSRPLPRATVRGAAAVPPPFTPVAGRASAPPPPPPPFPAGGVEARFSRTRPEIDERTPPPPGTDSAVTPRPHPASFDIEDALTPAPMSAMQPARGPAFGAAVNPNRAMPPAPYPAPALDPPLVLNQPQTMDFRGSITALLPEKKGGPPGWLAMLFIVASLIGGAALGHRVTRSEVEAAAAVTESPSTVPAADPRWINPKTVEGDPAVKPGASAPEPASPPDPAAPRPRGDLGGDTEPLVDKPEPAAAASVVAKPAVKAKSAKAQPKRRGGKAHKSQKKVSGRR
ncbi:MAG: protein kinase [Bacteroidota bacterium]